jgi:Family of unknown function (DUF6148)
MASTPGSLEEANEMYALYIAAEKAILTNQSYTIGSRQLTRADLSKVIASRKEWANKVHSLSSTGSSAPRVVRGVPNF